MLKPGGLDLQLEGCGTAFAALVCGRFKYRWREGECSDFLVLIRGI
jgi:hypothetical protein